MSAWINVKDRLPELNVRVLAWNDTWPKNSDQPFLAHYAAPMGWEDIRRGRLMPGVTHWMPAPEPPREGSNPKGECPPGPRVKPEEPGRLAGAPRRKFAGSAMTSEAERLAQALESMRDDRPWINAAAAELRRLSAENPILHSSIESLTETVKDRDAEIARLSADAQRLLAAAQVALDEMCRTAAPRDSFTDAVDALDAAIDQAIGRT